ncbi:MAG: hypothetical protein VKO65_01585 [Cyanobacteriota bacterium]|nr:hypothetical protein [Cyanobacteriota bacterium]
MATDPLDALRLALMQDVLPVGLAVADRVRRGGPREVLAAFDGTSPDPLGRLRDEGEPTARRVRDGLDRLQPGLGNPVMKVEVRDVPSTPVDVVTTDARPDSPAADSGAAADAVRGERQELLTALARIHARLDALERLLVAPAGSTESSGS